MSARPYPAQACGMRSTTQVVTTRTLGSARRIAQRALPELDLHRLRLPPAVALDVAPAPRLEAGDRVRQVARVGDAPPADLGDDVAPAQEGRALERLAARAAAQPR